MLVIQDEQLAKQIQQIAEQESRPVEDVLWSMVGLYLKLNPPEVANHATEDALLRIRRKAYAKARQYWQSVGAMDKAALTNEALDEQFGAFDEHGIPRLKSERESPSS